ncbi:DUF6602 domain-containing protein [Marinobacter algicola]|uniref:DUF6602 domain-containing protein n=1 Tax=Marinobacter algicola TaxID=236100 RepID=UPI003BAB0A55
MSHFNSKEFLKEVSEDLINNFDRASRGTTPGLKGAARENEVRKRLENALPSGVGVGTGCVIDYQGNASKQQDIILYERDICPKFSLNDTPETTYYPCEGVIAVGEVKSNIGKSEIVDSFSKIESVKRLKRLPIESNSVLTNEKIVSFRKYLSMGSFDCTKTEEFDQARNVKDQIFGFIFCGRFSVKSETICKHIEGQLLTINRSDLPNIIVSMNEGLLVPYNKDNNTLYSAVSEGTGYVYGESQYGNFEYLLAKLYQVIRSGRTVEVSVFEHYLIHEPGQMPISIKQVVGK